MIIDIIKTIELLQKMRQSNQKVFIRGSGIQGQKIQLELAEMGIVPDAFLDLDYHSIHKVNDIPVIDPEDIYSIPVGDCFVICAISSDEAYFSIRDEMEYYGMKERLHFIDFGIDGFHRMTRPLNMVPPRYSDRRKAMQIAVKNRNSLYKKHLPDSKSEMRYYDDRLFISSVDLHITTFCSLNCENCVKCISHLSNRIHLVPERIVADLDKLLSVAHIGELDIIGGEAFVHPKLPGIIRLLSKLNNLRKIQRIWVTTNGTILPSPEFFESFKMLANAGIQITDYGKYSKNMQGLISICKQYEIPHYILGGGDDMWTDAGDARNFRGYNEQELKHLLSICRVGIECNGLYDGKLYSCPRIAMLSEDGQIPCDENAFCDVRNTPENELRDKLTKYLFETKTFNGCQYCDGFYDGARKISMGTQL